ncbi:unnamed protein product [Schistosoma margrebowiei]|uniref:Uncharacterized protein n=1 Tax=Schistosoma margrebowiei TaxID=48269 RepID=A0A183M2U7_9TREM|nr:unnamed protein product [Schistosoma margrebowiei]
MQLDDFDFADHLALPFHTHQQMQVEIESITAVPTSVGLNVHNGRNNTLKYKTENTNQTNHTRWRNSETGGNFHTPGQQHHHRCTRRIRCTRRDKDWKSKHSIPALEQHTQLQTTVSQPTLVTIFNANVKTVSQSVSPNVWS